MRLFAVFWSFACAVGLALTRAVDFMLSYIEPLGERLVFGGDDPGLAVAGGVPLAAALQQGLRHEAGVPRRSAARHI